MMADLRNTQVISIEPAAWPGLAAEFADYSYEQSVSYVEMVAAREGGTVRLLGVVEAGNILGIGAVRLKPLPLVNRYVAYIAGGPMVRRKNRGGRENLSIVLSTLRHQLVEKEGNILYLRLPITLESCSEVGLDIEGLGFTPTRRVRSYNTIAVDLALDEGALMAGLAGKWRTDLRYAQKAGLNLETGAELSLFRRFLDLFGEMRDAKNFDVHVDPRTFFALLPDSVGLNISIATKDGKDAAGHVLSMLGNTAVYLFGATNDLGRSTKAGYLLNWQSMLFAKKAGLAYYDLGGTDANRNPGVHKFKSRIGGKAITALGPYEAIPDGPFGAVFDCLLNLREKFKRNNRP